MNCPNCGAENDADARFCAECGTPLEPQEAKTIVGSRVFDAADSDMTILSGRAEMAAQEKTMTVDPAQLAAEEPPPPSYVPPGGNLPGQESGGNQKRTLWIVVGVVLVLLLCCCCASIIAGIIFAEDIERAIGELRLLSLYS